MDVFTRNADDLPAGRVTVQGLQLKMVDGKVTFAVGGRPVNIPLLQRIVVELDATTMAPKVTLDILVPDLDIDVPGDVQVGAVVVPVTPGRHYEIGSNRVVTVPEKPSTEETA